MESTLQKPAMVAAKTIVYWIVTALFCLNRDESWSCT
jgi:hypothetical protein